METTYPPKNYVSFNDWSEYVKQCMNEYRLNKPTNSNYNEKNTIKAV
jgi:hypothetical protein